MPVRTRWSRRDAVLAVIGAIWISQGAVMVTTPNIGSRYGSWAALLAAVLSSPWSAAFWFSTGLVGLAFAAVGRARHRMSLNVAFGILVVPPITWASLYLYSAITALTSGMPDDQFWAPCARWAFFAVLVVTCAGMPDASRPPPARDRATT